MRFPQSLDGGGFGNRDSDIGTDVFTLRDWFAGQALIAIGYNDHVDGASDPERHAVTAYRIADAMIAERDKQ